ADGVAHTVSVQRLQPGDVVRVAVGDAFPSDGTLLDGPTKADEALLSGESHPVPKSAGDEVVAGSVNLSAPATVRIERVGADTRYEAIVALMREAMSQRPSATRVADRWAGPFLWCVLLLAGLAAIVWHFIDPSRSIWVAVSVLIVTCPCALSLAAPSALLGAAGALARRGVLLRRIDAIETLAHVDRVFLDKTGTLTDPQPVLTGTFACGGQDGEQKAHLLQEAASLASWSRHPLSQALVAVAPEVKALASRWKAVREEPGHGLEAMDDQGCTWRLGSADWLGVAASAGHADGTPQVWFGHPGQALLALRFDEALRADVLSAIQHLRAEGVHLTLLSGDGRDRVQRLAQRLGIADAVGHASPEDKLAALSVAQARGERVAMLGDGVNDAPVLARADVSFAMGHGAVVARLNADAVIVSDRLSDFVDARLLAQRTLRVMHQNLGWAALYNLACVPLALAGMLPPWAAGLGMALSSLLVVGNSLRLAR
ncbi:MAG TPA: heavy metal translocating P-type ATPase, partial [Burkholderiaceae bacterium]|nr:heavy metal translocating P-type ATPase [Burkholderiaceae bacterium]